MTSPYFHWRVTAAATRRSGEKNGEEAGKPLCRFLAKDWWRGAMPTFEAWLVKTYGSDLSKITEIKNVPRDVTGTWVGRRGF